MNNKTNLFIKNFNKLEDIFQRALRLNYHMSFVKMVRELSRKDAYIRLHEDKLLDIAELRNVLVHEAGKEIIAYPSDEAVDWLESVIEHFERPIKAIDLCQRKVIVAKGQIALYDAIQIMKGENYTKLPVYTKGTFVGLLTGSVVTRWMMNNVESTGDVLDGLINVTVSEVLTMYRKDNDVEFINRHTTAMELIEKNQSSRPYTGVYIITEHGEPDEKPLGIITDKDYSRIIEKVLNGSR